MKEERLVDGYYQSNIKTSRNEDSVYAMKYASQQILIDKLEEENKSLQSQLKAKEEAEKEFIKYLEAEKDRLAREVSQIYEDSLGKTKLVNEDIFNEVNNVSSKYNEILSKGENK